VAPIFTDDFVLIPKQPVYTTPSSALVQLAFACSPFLILYLTSPASISYIYRQESCLVLREPQNESESTMEPERDIPVQINNV